MNINLFTLKFKDEVFEQNFNNYYNNKILLNCRMGTTLAILSFISGSAFAYYGAGENVLTTISLYLTIPSLIIYFLISFIPNYDRYVQYNMIVSLNTTAAITLVILLLLPIGTYSIIGSIICIIINMYGYLLLKIRFIAASISGMITALLYIAFSYQVFQDLQLNAVYDPEYFAPSQDLTTDLWLYQAGFILLVNVIGMISSYAQELLERVNYKNLIALEKQKKQVELEREITNNLLLSIMPKAIAERMKSGETNISNYHEESSVMFVDIANFTVLASKITPKELLLLLNEVFSKFDSISEQYGIEKVKTIGDAYMAVAGVSVVTQNQNQNMALAALAFTETVSKIKLQNGEPLAIRVGIDTGPVTASVMGEYKFSYDVWGSTVNNAEKLESTAPLNRVQVSSSFYTKIQERFDLEKSPNNENGWVLKGERAIYA